jgi:hypothetical protein
VTDNLDNYFWEAASVAAMLVVMAIAVATGICAQLF